MRIHLIAVGEGLENQLASVLRQQGHEVGLSASGLSEAVKGDLAAHGVMISDGGADADQIGSSLDLVVAGRAVPASHPGLVKAQALGLKICSLAEMVYGMVQHRQRIVITGHEGRATVLAMVAHVLGHIGKLFGYLTTGPMKGSDGLLRLDTHLPMMVMEGEETPASMLEEKPSFLHLHHHITVITGIPADGGTQPFEQLIDHTRRSGAIIYHEGDKQLRRLIKNAKLGEDIEAIPYTEHPHLVKDGIAYLLDENQNRIALKVAGKDNLQYISAAFEVCQTVRVEPGQFYAAISSFEL